MPRVNIKPLSINEAFKGRRFKTDAYKNYTHALMYMLPKKIDLPPPPFEVHYTFGLSSSLADWDNPIKPLQDILQKKYKFNDKVIKRGIVDIVDVDKGKEYVEFEIFTLKK